MKAWTLKTEEILSSLMTDPEKGLSPAEAEKRLLSHGPNILKQAKGTSAWALFFGQFKSLIIWVLVAAAILSGVLQEWVDTGAILAIIILNASLGFFQEYRAEKSLAALKKLSTPTARVIRDGHKRSIPSAQLVPGDLVELEAGDHIPADGRLVWATAFRTQEASLTGESTPVTKETDRSLPENTPLGDRATMAFMGTAAISGKARMIVTGTGMDTELGKIAGLLAASNVESTPLQKRLESLGRWLVYLCLVIVAVVFGLGIIRGVPFVEMFLTAVSLAVAAIPEGLPAVVTMALAVGVQRMVKRHALIRKLPAVETLGSTNVICSDKTGTLTQNEMTVRQLWAGGIYYEVTGTGYMPKGEIRALGQPIAQANLSADLNLTLRAGVLCNGAALHQQADRWSVVGDPTEGALLAAAAKIGLQQATLENDEPRIAEIPFDSERKRMTVLCRRGSGWRAYMKGAPDVVLNYCRLDDAERSTIHKSNENLAAQGLRVLAMAYRDFDQKPTKADAQTLEQDLVFTGLAAMQDPPRPEAADAIRRCRGAGIRVVMITGDHPGTARAVASELGLMGPGQESLTGLELDPLSDEELTRRVEMVGLYARVSAEHKLRIVRAWHARGMVVAMTGDGVNDAPALKEADIGIAMGITGTDVTKEVADMVVMDDNFASIEAAVEEGRGIYENIRKFVFYLLSCNTGEVLVMFIASLAGWPLPLLPVQILWLNLVTDGLPALALGVEPPPEDLMRRPVRRRDEEIINRAFMLDMLGTGLLIAACALAAFGYVYIIEEAGLERARSMSFLVLALAQLIHAFNSRSIRLSIFQIGLFSNRWLVGAVVISVALQAGIMIWEPAQTVFKTVAPNPQELGLAAGLSLLPLVVIEGIKRWRRTRP